MRRFSPRSTFAALTVRNYRLFATGQVISVTGTWMQKMAQSWLVLELTNSGLVLGLTTAAQQLPSLLFTPVAGLFTDRTDRRKLLLWAQVASIAPALALGALAWTHHATTWLIIVLAFVLGCIDAVEKPSRMTFAMDVVGRRHLANAVMLNGIVQNSGKVVGPAVAGALIATVGLPDTFFLNAVSFLPVIAGLMMMRRDELHPTEPAPRRKGQLREGFAYAWNNRALRGPLLLMTVSGTLAYNFPVVLPLLAKDTFTGGPELAGSLFTAMGVGAIVGGLSVAGVTTVTQGRLARSGLLFAGLLAASFLAPNTLTALLAMCLLGATSVTFRAVATTLVQLTSDPAMRGRVISLLLVALNGTTPIGAPVIGWVGEHWGARAALLVGAVATAAAALFLLRRTDRVT
ncbi:MFS transporter [Amycolatopsis acidicola]|uniref:MFS transporter n=1 Tax=Amycolatopsis acidicola TaxID=2596893 RepID=A0A5N0UXV3_9PSEU|nr:MFS transporter [Amycolatopsis acidicola]